MNEVDILRSRRIRGFTLIELMVTVAIVAILAAVAYPAYTRYLIRSNRAAAASYVLQVSDLQQRYLLDARAYAASMTELNASVPDNVARFYDVTTAKVGTAGFNVVASPKGSQLARDTDCGTLTVNDAGTKTASGGASTCW
jgi:type IV pilus assembly protein PilE